MDTNLTPTTPQQTTTHQTKPPTIDIMDAIGISFFGIISSLYCRSVYMQLSGVLFWGAYHLVCEMFKQREKKSKNKNSDMYQIISKSFQVAAVPFFKTLFSTYIFGFDVLTAKDKKDAYAGIIPLGSWIAELLNKDRWYSLTFFTQYCGDIFSTGVGVEIIKQIMTFVVMLYMEYKEKRHLKDFKSKELAWKACRAITSVMFEQIFTSLAIVSATFITGMMFASFTPSTMLAIMVFVVNLLITCTLIEVSKIITNKIKGEEELKPGEKPKSYGIANFITALLFGVIINMDIKIKIAINDAAKRSFPILLCCMYYINMMQRCVIKFLQELLLYRSKKYIEKKAEEKNGEIKPIVDEKAAEQDGKDVTKIPKKDVTKIPNTNIIYKIRKKIYHKLKRLPFVSRAFKNNEIKISPQTG